MIRTVKTRFAFNGLPKGHVFTFDPEKEPKVLGLLQAGLVAEVIQGDESVIIEGDHHVVIEMPSIESAEGVGDIGGEGQDQSPEGGVDRAQVVDAPGAQGLQGDQGTVAKVAKRR